MDPNKIPRVRKIHEAKTHFLICNAQFFDIKPSIVADKADEKIIEEPTYPKYKIGGCIANAGSCNIGFNPNPSSGVGNK